MAKAKEVKEVKKEKKPEVNLTKDKFGNEAIVEPEKSNKDKFGNDIG